jgi:L-2,4-diaminobutyric acid acetyltransferase
MEVPTSDILTRQPESRDGLPIHHLIANSPPLDLNSIYSYYLLSDHFRETCIVAEFQGVVVGFVSAYFIPKRPQTLFIWQVVVDSSQRGHGVALQMINALLTRLGGQQPSAIETTVNPSNVASRALFERLARQWGSTLEMSPFLEALAFGPEGEHESEILLRIPLPSSTNQ